MKNLVDEWEKTCCSLATHKIFFSCAANQSPMVLLALSRMVDFVHSQPDTFRSLLWRFPQLFKVATLLDLCLLGSYAFDHWPLETRKKKGQCWFTRLQFNRRVLLLKRYPRQGYLAFPQFLEGSSLVCKLRIHLPNMFFHKLLIASHMYAMYFASVQDDCKPHDLNNASVKPVVMQYACPTCTRSRFQ